MIIKKTINQTSLPVEDVMYEFYDKTDYTDPVTGLVVSFNTVVSRDSLMSLESKKRELDNMRINMEAQKVAALANYDSQKKAYDKGVLDLAEMKRLITSFK